MDKHIIVSLLKESALIGWSMGAGVFLTLLVGLTLDGITNRFGVSVGLQWWYFISLVTGPTFAWFLIFK